VHEHSSFELERRGAPPGETYWSATTDLWRAEEATRKARCNQRTIARYSKGDEEDGNC